MNITIRLAVVALLVGGVSLSGIAAQQTVGFSEDFDSVDGWKYDEPAQTFESMKSIDGVLVIDTWVGSIGGTKPPEQEKTYKATSGITKQYDQEVDLDKYHYLVMKTDEKSMYSIVYLNGKGTQVNYTTGLLVQDIRQLGLSGKQKIKISLDVMNTGRLFKADYIRLVSELDQEQRAALIGPPVAVYTENIAGHPFQKLHALDARSARLPERRPDEQVMFRDVGTKALTFKMTSNPSDQGFSEQYRAWQDDGRGFYLIPGGRDYYSFEQQAFTRSPANPYGDKYDAQGYKGPDRKHSMIRRWDAQAGKWQQLGLVPGNTTFIGGSKLVTREGEAMQVFDLSAEKPLENPKVFKVPYESGKGNDLSADGKWLSYFGPWGTYQRIVVDTDTGESHLGATYTFTHGMHGQSFSLMSYGSGAKLIVPGGLQLSGDDKPGQKLRLYGPFADEVKTDYGIMSGDGRFGFTNGIGGDLADQYVAFDAADPGTLLRLATYNVSKVTWRIWTKIIPSPDYTKLMYISDMLGDGDFYLAVIRRPDAPTNLAAQRVEGGVKLTWAKPARSAETAGYVVYRSRESGKGFEAITDKLVEGTEYTDAAAPADAACFYLVAAREHSGLEGDLSNEAAEDLAYLRSSRLPAVRLHFEAEDLARTLPMRLMFDGEASSFHAVRITPVAQGEDKQAGTLTLPHAPGDGKYRLWIRAKTKQAGDVKIHVGHHSNEPVATIQVKSSNWSWTSSEIEIPLLPGVSPAIALTSLADGLAIDKIILSSDSAYAPAGADDRIAPPQPVSDLKVAKADANSISLQWNPPAGAKPYFYMVYVGDKADFAIGNDTALVRTFEPKAQDWGVASGKQYFYKVVAYDHRLQPSEPVAVEAATAKAQWTTRELAAIDAKLGEGLVASADQDVKYVAAEAGKEGVLTLDFEVPAGTYYLWMEYGARFAKEPQKLALSLDGKDIGTWDSREPHRMGRDLDPKLGKVRWFVDRVIWNPERYKTLWSTELAEGKHSLGIKLTEKNPWISKVWVTSDPSFVPPGYSAQVRFNTNRRQK